MRQRLAFASYRKIGKFCGSEVDQVKDNAGDNDQGKTDTKDITHMTSGFAFSSFICRQFRMLANGRHSVLR
jgi:hypothetical protein